MTSQYIGKYEIVATLGRGSMGVVYKARDPEIGRIVAIKTLRSVFLSDDAAGNEAMQRFRLEARSAGSLHHPNIVTIFEAARTDSGSPYIVMEYIDGISLESTLREQERFEVPAVLHYLSQVANAIDYAHLHNVIHRDIKPSNILTDAQHRSHLLDFGVAKISDTSLTPAGTVVGTPSYMSPEQIRGEQLDGSTDVFSLAVVTFEALTGKRPFPGKDFSTVVSNIIHKDPLSFKEVGCDLPVAVEASIAVGLCKDRAQRRRTALEFIDSLARSVDALVDNNGLVGGFTPGMGLKDLASQTNNVDEVEACKLEGDSNDVSVLTIDEIDSETPVSSSLEAIQEQEPMQDSSLNDPIEPVKESKEDSISKEIDSSSFILSSFISKEFLWFFWFLVIGVVVALFFLFQDKYKQTSTIDTLNVASDIASEQVIKKVPETMPSPRPVKVSIDPESLRDVNGVYSIEMVSSLENEQLGALLIIATMDKELLEIVVQEVGRRSEPALLKGLRFVAGSSDYRMRVGVIKALRDSDLYQHNDGFSILVSCLYDDEYLVRGWAAKVLGMVSSERSRRALLARLNVENQDVVIEVIRKALSKLGDGLLKETDESTASDGS